MSFKITGQQVENWVARNFEYKKRSNGKQLTVCNPMDGDDGWHFWISLIPDKNRHGKTNFWVHDFRPGHKQWDGSFLNFVQTYKKISYFDAVKEVTGESAANIKLMLRNIKKDEIQEEEIKFIRMPESAKPFSDKADTVARKITLNYLNSRKISEDKAIKNKLHYTVSSVVFPYYEYGALVYWQERDIMNKVFNFPNEEEYKVGKTDFIYGFDNIEPQSDVVIVEAIIGALTIEDNAAATGGADIVGKQIKKLKVLDPRIVVLAPDSDEAGIKSLRNNFFALRSMFKLAYCIPPSPYKDWNEFDQNDGIGSSRNYINKNVAYLTMADMIRMTTKFIV